MLVLLMVAALKGEKKFIPACMNEKQKLRSISAWTFELGLC